MIVSSGLPTCMEGMMYPVPFVNADDLVTIAKHAEALGYHSVWGNDHMTTQQYVREEFSYSPNFWEPLVTYANLAAHTHKLKFGTGMLVTPMRRDIVVVAKQIATLDHLSHGRFMLGFGVGAYREEFEALHPDWKVHRGNLVEESIQVLTRLFTEDTVTWQGEYFHLENVNMYPKPYQSTLPLYVGGNSINSIRRTAAYGNGWLPAGMPVEIVQERVRQLKELLNEQKRDLAEIDVALQLVAYLDHDQEKALSRFRKSQMYKHLVSLGQSTLKDQKGRKHEAINLIGTPEHVIEKISRFKEAGVKHLCGTYFCAETKSELMDQMQFFAEEVIPHI